MNVARVLRRLWRRFADSGFAADLKTAIREGLDRAERTGGGD